MSDLELTKEERDYAMRVAHSNYSTSRHWAYCASFVLPMLMFCLYGLLRNDFIAEFIAFFGLLLFLLWRISQETENLRVRKSFFHKVAEHERKHSA